MQRRPSLRILVLAAALLAAGCASPPPLFEPPAVTALLRDDAFGPPHERVDPEAPLRLSDAMREFVRTRLPAAGAFEDRRRVLLDHLYRKGGLALQYDASATRTAAEAFDARAGNCLSLVMMTAAFAKAVDVPVRFRRVYVDEAWSRTADLMFAAGHVNLALDSTRSIERIAAGEATELLVDFLPGANLRGQRAQSIGEPTVVSMYMNNRAAEHLVAGDVTQAYWFAREAVRADPMHSMAFNTLGVVYLRHGLLREARGVFEAVLAREPENAKVLGNLVVALRRDGREAEAQAAAQRLAAIEPVPPFHWFDAGLAALQAQDWVRARELFERELRREPGFHETHFRLAQAELALGNVKAAQRHLEQARAVTTTVNDSALYAAKLDRLRAALH